MEKNQIVKLVSRIKDRFPDEFFRLSKEEKYEYVETFEKLFIRFDFDLVDKAISRIFDMRYIKAPTFMQMQLSVSRMLFERRSDVFVKMRNHGLDVNNVEAQEIITAYKEGLGIGFLARYYHTTFNEVKNFLLSKNVDLRQQISIKDDEDKIQLMIRDYLNKMPKRELELKYHCDYRTIKQILVIRKIELRNKNKFTDSEYLDIIRMYCDNNITITEITKRYKINITTIYKILKRFNIKFKRNNISKSVHSLKD